LNYPGNKENALRIINFNQPERVEVCVPMKALSYLGCDHEGYSVVSQIDKERYGVWNDIWGTTWRLYPGGISEMPIAYPLTESRQDIKQCEWPDPNDERLIAKIHQDLVAINNPEEGFLTGLHRDLLWEKSYMLAGMENVMIWFKHEAGLVKEIFHRIMDFQLGIARHYLDVGVEMVKFADDLGGQNNSLFSHDIFVEFMLPEYRRIFDFYRENDVLIYLHSCGHIEKFLDDYMDLGVNILNPVQATANNLDRVREKTFGKIVLEGGVNSSVVMHGEEEEVEQEVIKRIMQLGQNGGYICKPDQTMPYPERNIRKLIDTVERYGSYPISTNVS